MRLGTTAMSSCRWLPRQSKLAGLVESRAANADPVNPWKQRAPLLNGEGQHAVEPLNKNCWILERHSLHK
jgi:hypothetical protein